MSTRGRVTFSEASPCPCGSKKPIKVCCLQTDGTLRKAAPEFLPPPPATANALKACYLSSTLDCDDTISGEHYISAGILKLLHSKPGSVQIVGAAWAPGAKEIGISSLRANILCRRHNSALANLDNEALIFFETIRSIHHRTAPAGTKKYQLYSGTGIELWAVKMAAGLYWSGSAADETGKRFLGNYAFHVAPILSTGVFEGRCGLYVNAQIGQRLQGDPLEAALLSTVEDGGHICGLEFRFYGLRFRIITHPRAVTVFAPPSEGWAFRPSQFLYARSDALHVLTLSWMRGWDGGSLQISFN